MNRDTRSSPVAPAGYSLLKSGQVTLILHARSLLVFALLAVLLFTLLVLSIPLGSSSLTPQTTLLAMFGEGSRSDLILVQRLRMPRTLAAMLAGFALGAAGCLVQTMARNRLATPEILGQDAGASFAMTVFIMVTSAQLLGPWWLASFGALATGCLLWWLAGGIGLNGYRVLIIGIGLSALLRSLTELLMSKADLEHASAIYAWTQGSFEGRLYDISAPAALILTLLLPCVILAARRLSLLQFSENVSTALGLDTEKARLLIFFSAIFLASLGVGIGGPIPFVGLAAPIITSRLTGPATVPVINSALVGAILVLCADTGGRLLAAPGEIPAGILTSMLGGPFLLWVLLSDRRI